MKNFGVSLIVLAFALASYDASNTENPEQQETKPDAAPLRQTVVAQYGSSAVFRCPASSLASNVAWLHNDRPVQGDTSSSRLKVSRDQRRLSISSVRPSDDDVDVTCICHTGGEAQTPHHMRLHTVPSLERYLEEALGGQLDIQERNYSNWDGTTFRQRVFVVRPDVDQLQAVVAEAAAAGLPMRAVSSAYSYSDHLPDEDHLVVEMGAVRSFLGDERCRLGLELSQDINGRSFVRAAAGIDMGELAEFLVENDVQLRNPPSVTNVLVVGAFSTASTNGFTDYGSLSEHVAGVTVLDGAGTYRTYTADQHPTQLAALRACVGLCGFITEMTIRVEPLAVTRVSDLFVRTVDAVGNATWLTEQLAVGGFIVHWAPHTSEPWDPWHDLVWIRLYEETEPGTEPDARGQKAPGRETAQRMTQRGGGPGNTSFLGDRPDSQLVYHPHAVTYIDADTLDLTYSMQYVVEDDAAFSQTNRAIQVVFDLLQRWPGDLPVVTVLMLWTGVSHDCYLCPAAFVLPSTTHLFRMELIADTSLDEYPEFLNQLFEDMKDTDIRFRFHWGKYYSYVSGLADYMSYAFDNQGQMSTFKSVLQQEQWDPQQLFPNEYFREVFNL